MDTIAGDVSANILRADALISAAPGADLYLLPEMFSTGFAMFPDGCAEDEDGASLRWMQQKAAVLDAALCGSVATRRTDGTFVNRMYFVTPDGTVTRYDKRHLFSFSGEDLRYRPGRDRIVVTFRGVRFLLLVCYDLRFPVWCRCRDDYDALLCVANWPVKRRHAWDVLLRARAAENQCYVCGCNRVGTDDLDCVYDGGSALINPYGEALTPSSSAEEVLTADIDMEHLVHYRQRFPLLKDSDDFEIKL